MRRLNGEGGAVTVFVALMLIVVFGMGALVVDVGHLYWERRQLQTGAEAGALAVAADCVEGVIDCANASVSILGNAAQPYADLNAKDLRSGVPLSMPHGTDAAACAPGSDVAPNPLVGPNHVKVTTETVDASTGANYITHVLAPIFRIVEPDPTVNVETKTVTACAVAAWGYAASMSTFPLVISACEYNLATVTYPGPHPNTSVPNQPPILFHAGGGAGDECNAQAGQDTDGDGFLPAGFGWLENDGSCQIVTTVVNGDEWVNKEQGADTECGDTEFASLLNTVIQIPVFNDFCRPAQDPAPDCPDYSSKDKYRIATYASYYLTGYKLSGNADYKGGDYSECGPSELCIDGYFTTSTALDGDIGGPVGGVMIVKLEG